MNVYRDSVFERVRKLKERGVSKAYATAKIRDEYLGYATSKDVSDALEEHYGKKDS